MSEFLKYVLWILQNSLVLVLLAGIGVAVILGISYSVHKRKYKGEKKFPWGKVFLWLIFIGYLAVVLYATTFRPSFGHRAFNLHLFRAWREAWNNFSQHRWLNVLLNIAMFGPLGFLLPLLNNRYRKWYLSIPVSLLASLSIETFQLIFSSGVFDVDDLFCNTLGAVMGYLAIMLVLSMFNGKGKRLKPVIAYVCLLLIPIFAIGSIFVAYHVQEYGNLPNAAGYRVNLDHLKWNLDCELSDTAENVPIYRARTMSKADSDALAEEMAALIGQEVDQVSYYQEMAYYYLNQGIFLVNYHDGSYELGGYDHNITEWDVVDRDVIETALEKYPIAIPDVAEFESEGEGWYSFTCSQHIDGSMMLDGTLRVRYGVEDTIRRIENNLVWYTYYKDAPIISPEAAFEELKSGFFGSAEMLKSDSFDSVTVISCKLAHEIDTKGFYQPVYSFEVLIPDTGTLVVMIPAMK